MPTNAGPPIVGGAEAVISEEEIRNRLEYIAEILFDLQSLSGASGGPTLNGLLALAHAEASLQVKRLQHRKDDVL